MSTHYIFFCGEIKKILSLLSGAMYNKKKKKKKKKDIWDWQKLVLIAEWSYFCVVLIAEFYLPGKGETASLQLERASFEKGAKNFQL